MFKIFTDGSTRNNKCGEGIGAWGFVVVNENDEIIDKYVAGEFETTNNRMEMKAVIGALEWLSSAHSSGIIIMDSNLVFRGITEWMAGWKNKDWIKADKTEVANKDLWMIINELVENNNVFFEKTRGHADDKYNNYIDKLVQNETLKMKEGLK